MSEKQLLIESCDFSFSCNLSDEKKTALTESLKISAGKNDTLIVKNIPCTILNRRNQNGRIYPTALMQKAIEAARPKMQNRELICSGSEHPEMSYCPLEKGSHVVINAYIKNVDLEVDGEKGRYDVLFNDWLVLPTDPHGKNLKTYILNNVSVGTSIRSLGSCDPDGTVTELDYLGTDCVSQPSSLTRTIMNISESVEVSAAPLTETYIVSASATNVVRDLDSALALSQQIDSANFGTVKKTSTKLDSEVDPKTGAETTMVTLETETEDEVSELDQALAMAKQAMMNGKADIDSVTIENVKEEQPKESVENKDDEKALNEDNTNLGLKKIVDIKGVEITGPDEKELWRVSAELRNADDHNAMEWQRSYKSLVDAGVEQTYLDYANGKDMVAENGLQEGDDGHYASQPYLTPILNHILKNVPRDTKAYEVAIKIADGIVTGRIKSTEEREAALEELKKYVDIKYDDGYIPESEMGESEANQVENPEKRAERAVQMQYNFIVSNTQEADPERQQAENIFAKFEQGQASAIDTREALYNIASGLQKKLWGESKDTEYNTHEFTPKGVDWIYDSVISLMWNDGLTLEQACRKFCEQNDNIPYEYLLEYMRTAPMEESVITEAKEEKQEDPNKGKQYVLKTNQGFVAMDGNAISFVDNPKDAIHFVKGNEESGVIHLSGINKILNTMGILDSDIEKYFKKDSIDISAHDDVNVQAAESDGVKVEECGTTPMTEENGSNTRFKATVKINGANGESTEDVPVSAVDMEGINAEVANLYDMKKQKADGELVITVTDTASGQQFMLNPETRQIEPMNTQMESAGDIEQDGNKLSMEVDDDNKVEKEFNTPAQAAVAKAGIESGKLGGDVLLSEDDTSLDDDDEESDTAKCAWCGEEFEKSALRKEKDLGYLCNTCARGIESREGPLTFEEAGDEIPVKTDYSYENIEPGWYASAPSVGIVGPYDTEEELRAVLGKEVCEIADSDKGLVNIDYVEDDDDALAAESTKIDEVMFNEPGKASDPYVEKPLNDSVGNVIVEVDNINWDDEDLYNNFLVNYEPGDPVTFDDIESKVKDLPSATTVKINMDELPDNIDSHTFKNCVLDSLRKTYAMKANDADIISVNYIN